MRTESPVLILDADGVFLSERPYWNAALGTALDRAGLSDAVRERWDAVADYAFGPIGLQRVTKGRGCNSNWDLAAVLVRALEEESWSDVVGEMLAADREYDAMHTLALAANFVWDRAAPFETADETDPLAAAGIDRRGSFYTDTVKRFQQVLHGEAGLGWRFERWRLRGDGARTRDAFARLARRGWRLRVCTGRNRDEIEEPIRVLGLGEWLPAAGITSGDEVERAERESGRRSLGKPHWFAPACAALGYATAVEALANGELRAASTEVVYAGDAWADFVAVEACRRRGLPLAYLHVRSGVTTRDQEITVGVSPGTIAVVDDFESIAEVLA